MRKPKTERVPRTRAGGKWTEAAFWGFLRSRLRLAWRSWPPRAEVLRAARIPYAGEDRRWSYVCARCLRPYKHTEVQVDHVTACGALRCWEDLPTFASRLFVEAHGMRVLCRGCHQERTSESRA